MFGWPVEGVCKKYVKKLKSVLKSLKKRGEVQEGWDWITQVPKSGAKETGLHSRDNGSHWWLSVFEWHDLSIYLLCSHSALASFNIKGLFYLVFFFFFFKLCHVACEVLVPQPGIESGPLAVTVPSPNHWTASRFPKWMFYFL